MSNYEQVKSQIPADIDEFFDNFENFNTFVFTPREKIKHRLPCPIRRELVVDLNLIFTIHCQGCGGKK